MTFADPGIRLRHVVSDIEKHFAVTSMEPGLRIAGTEELGLADDPPSWRRAEVLAKHLRRSFLAPSFRTAPAGWARAPAHPTACPRSARCRATPTSSSRRAMVIWG